MGTLAIVAISGSDCSNLLCIIELALRRGLIQAIKYVEPIRVLVSSSPVQMLSYPHNKSTRR